MKHKPAVRIAHSEEQSPIVRAVALDIGRQLADLLQVAQDLGFVITVDLESKTPLAMGNYRMLGIIRGERRK